MRHFGKLSLQVPLKLLSPDRERVEEAAQNDGRPHRAGRGHLGHDDPVGVVDDLGALVGALMPRRHAEFGERAQRAQRLSAEAERVYGGHVAEVGNLGRVML